MVERTFNATEHAQNLNIREDVGSKDKYYCSNRNTDKA